MRQATPANEYSAHNVAVALFGMYNDLWSDPGSDLMAEVIQKLSEWVGIKHQHESNRVEGFNEQILASTEEMV